MNRQDLIQHETMGRDMYRREAKRRAKRYPAVEAVQQEIRRVACERRGRGQSTGGFVG